MKDVNDLLKQALAEKELLSAGEEFLVRDLFIGYEWNRIPFKIRLLLGTLLLNHIHAENGNISAIAKTSSNQQKYKKLNLSGDRIQ